MAEACPTTVGHVQQDGRHPVIAGFAALGGVAVILGVVVGVVVIVGTRLTGLGGGSASADASLDIPSLPSLVSHSPLPSGPSEPDVAVSSDTPSASTSTSATAITLAASTTSVTSMQQVTLTGTYDGGDGEIVQVQEESGGSWAAFPIPGVAVSGGRFTTYIQTGHTGTFRVIDTTTDATSNAVTITVQ